MSDPRRSAQQDRRIQEQIQTLFGDTRNPLDRAVRLRDLLDTKGPALSPLLDLMGRTAQNAVKSQLGTSHATINDAIKAGREAAEEAAKRAEDAQSKLNQVKFQVDGAIEGLQQDFEQISTDLDLLDAQVDADIEALASIVQGDIDAIHEEINGQFGTVEDRLNTELPRIVSIDRALEDATSLILENATNLSLIGRRMADAGIYVDPSTGEVRIYAVRALEESVGAVSVELDAAKASIELKATYAYVDGKISDALLDPTQIPVISEMQLTLNQVALDLDAMQGTIDLKADQLTVSGMQVTLGQVQVALDSANAAIALRAEKSEFDEAVARLDAAEIAIDATAGITLQAQSFFGEYRALEDFQEQTLDALLRAYNGRELLNSAFAGAMRQMQAITREGLDAEATERLTLRAEYQASTAALYQENSARATETAAVATSLAGIVARFNVVEGGYASVAYVTQTTYTKAQVDQAISLLEQELSSDLDGLNSTLTQTYYTKTQADNATATAIAAMQATLQSSINGVSANLSNNYYTSVQTDGAINAATSAVQTNLSSQVGAINSNLTTNYYTKSATDGAIGSAVSALETSLSSQIGSVQSSLNTGYYTRSQVDSAISGLQTTLQSGISGVANDLGDFQSNVALTYATNSNLNSALAGLEQSFRASLNRSTPPTDFLEGPDNWTSTRSGTPEAVAVPNGTWVFNGQVATQALPSNADGALLATRGAIPVDDGDSVRITVILKVTGTGNGLTALDCVFDWLDAAYNTATITRTRLPNDLAPGSYVTISGTARAPADAFFVRGGIIVDGRAYAAGAAVEVKAIKVENLMSLSEIEAGISNNFYTKATADAAIAAAVSSYDASVEGGLSANVTQTAAAISDLSGAVASYSVLVSAGDEYNVAGLEVVAWNDGVKSSTAVRLWGDNVIVPGTLSTASLVVTDGSGELIPNWNFFSGDLRGWTQKIGTAAYVAQKTAGLPGMSTANALYAVAIPAGATAHTVATTQRFPAAENQRFSYSFEAACSGNATGATARMRVRFFDQGGAYINGANTAITVTSTSWVQGAGEVVAPAGSVSAEVSLVLTPAVDQILYCTNISLVRQRSGAILITPNSIGGAQLITTEELITAAAQIGQAVIVGAHIQDLTVDTLKIAGNAITVPVVSEALQTSHTVSINMEVSGTLFIHALFNQCLMDGLFATEITLNGNVVRNSYGRNLNAYTGSILRLPIPAMAVVNVPAGIHVIGASINADALSTFISVQGIKR